MTEKITVLLATVFLFACSRQDEEPIRSRMAIKSGYMLGRYPAKGTPPCEEVYRGVYIDCRPGDARWIDDKSNIHSADELRIACRRYIDRVYGKRNPDRHMGCHQMDGGLLVIDGAWTGDKG